MFAKVLIAEDLGSIATGIQTVITQLGIRWEGVSYCDDAYLKVKTAAKSGAPFPLLITDLSFKSDHRAQRFVSGEELLATLRKEHPELKIIVYSIEDRVHKVRALLDHHGINGYVCKGREGLHQLQAAIGEVYNNQTYLSPQVAQAATATQPLDISEYDIWLMRQLAAGLANREISAHFVNTDVQPSSVSAIEKRILRLRELFNAKNAVQLVAMAKDLGLI